MANDTKKLIYYTFIDLLHTKPFDKITVRDIVEACEINRNTFYYHYTDIYDLLEEIGRKRGCSSPAIFHHGKRITKSKISDKKGVE